MDAMLLLLADGRFPSGGHAHSGGLEAAVAAGRVRDLADLDAFLRGRLATAGLVAAAFAAAACAGADLADLDHAFDARTPSPALRQASRQQGRALLRAARSIWPIADAPKSRVPGAPGLDRRVPRPEPPEPRVPDAVELHHPVALGAVAAVAGLKPADAALAAALGAVTVPASAAVRLLGLDPYAVHALLARLAPECDRIATTAAAQDPPADLPAAAAPLLDLSAEVHARWEVRLFAS